MNSFYRIAAVFRQEFQKIRRNLWVLLASGMLLLFSLTLAFLAANQSAMIKADVLTISAASLATLSVYLLPLIALLLSYDSISGETERGTLALTLSTPLERWELFTGKFLAQILALALSVLIGFLLTAALMSILYPITSDGIWAWIRLISSSILLGAIFIALGMFLSTLARRSVTVAAMVVGVWLVFVVLYDMALLVSVMADGGGVYTKSIFPWLVLANPGDAFRIYNLSMLETVPISGLDGLARTLPFPVSFLFLSLLFWLVLSFVMGLYRMKKVMP